MLIRPVLNSIPIYQMSVNVLSGRVKQKIYGMFNCFLWGASVAKWIYSYENNKDNMWRKVVCARSKSNQNNLLLELENRGNQSVLLGFMNSLWAAMSM